MNEAAIEKLIGQGLLGVLLVIALGVIVFLYKETKTERNCRLNDMKDVWQSDVKYREELKGLIQNILDLLRGRNNK